MINETQTNIVPEMLTLCGCCICCQFQFQWAVIDLIFLLFTPQLIMRP